MQDDNTKQSYTRWMFAGMPATLATSPLATFIPLYILFIGGTIGQVALAAIVLNFSTIISFFFWGRLADIMKGRKNVIMASYVMITILLFLLYFTSNIDLIIVEYALIGIFASAEGTYLNLLVLETDASENWPKNFARLQAIQNVGLVIGLVIGSIITGVASLKYFIFVLAIASLISTVVGVIYIKETSSEIESISLRKRLGVVVSSMAAPFQTVMLPRKGYLKNGGIGRAMRSLFASMGSYIGLFYISYFMYAAASTAYNADYPAILHLQGVTESQVFTVIVVAIALQTVVFYYANRLLKRKSFYTMTLKLLTARAAICFFVAISFLFVGSVLFYSNLILYALAAGIVYPLYYTTSYSLFFDAIKGRNKGNALGVYSGLASIGSFIGAIVAGVIAVSGSYYLIYIVVGLMIIVGIYAMYLVPKSKIRKNSSVTFSSASEAAAT